MGLFYGAATKALGFTPGKHEGKVTGLAAYESPDSNSLKLCRSLAKFRNMSYYAPHVIGAYPKIVKCLKKVGAKPFAASFQKVLEEVVCEFIESWVKETGIKKIGLAGGVFGNVKLNQKIHELDIVDEIFVFPHMADGGLGYGAAMDTIEWKSRPIKNVYLGPDFSDDQIKEALIKNKLVFTRPDDPASVIADCLIEGLVVSRFGGRMEFGPRALGNRSILYRPDKPEVNDWLNKALKRNEFMPFAPVTLYEHANDCYIGLSGAERSAEYMTITFECTEKMKRNSPAVVHVDGTARPQLIKREQNPFYYDIVKNFYIKTGIPSIVNTSFNMHEEPIVCTPEDAIRSFTLGNIDVLSIGPFICFIKDQL
tara:strand:- start:1873 stop:2976 length:1104 start_codon:yes stop_codon:yes gene_type:complete